ncbi:MAG TPA: hypothetical protein PLV93_11250 [Microthrixaceae bacterium]|nr:hypothetical protein [Microthrixaceae bacterium]
MPANKRNSGTGMICQIPRRTEGVAFQVAFPLRRRRAELVVTLDGNVRQRDPAERRALAELRAGSVPKAVAWYARNDRVQVQSSRVDTLVAMTDAWSTDLAAGHDTALLAWRRQDVADLNRLACECWDKLGRLPGDDVKVNGGRSYATGDRLVALAPNPQAGIVTSEPLTAVEVDRDSMVVSTTDGREVTAAEREIAKLTPDANAEHLEHIQARNAERAAGRDRGLDL